MGLIDERWLRVLALGFMSSNMYLTKTLILEH